jgi:hypothetical protein
LLTSWEMHFPRYRPTLSTLSSRMNSHTGEQRVGHQGVIGNLVCAMHRIVNDTNISGLITIGYAQPRPPGRLGYRFLCFWLFMPGVAGEVFLVGREAGAPVMPRTVRPQPVVGVLLSTSPLLFVTG